MLNNLTTYRPNEVVIGLSEFLLHPLEKMPYEIMLIIFRHLSPHEILQLRQTGKLLLNVINTILFNHLTDANNPQSFCDAQFTLRFFEVLYRGVVAIAQAEKIIDKALAVIEDQQALMDRQNAQDLANRSIMAYGKYASKLLLTRLQVGPQANLKNSYENWKNKKWYLQKSNSFFQTVNPGNSNVVRDGIVLPACLVEGAVYPAWLRDISDKIEEQLRAYGLIGKYNKYISTVISNAISVIVLQQALIAIPNLIFRNDELEANYDMTTKNYAMLEARMTEIGGAILFWSALSLSSKIFDPVLKEFINGLRTSINEYFTGQQNTDAPRLGL